MDLSLAFKGCAKSRILAKPPLRTIFLRARSVWAIPASWICYRLSLRLSWIAGSLRSSVVAFLPQSSSTMKARVPKVLPHAKGSGTAEPCIFKNLISGCMQNSNAWNWGVPTKLEGRHGGTSDRSILCWIEPEENVWIMGMMLTVPPWSHFLINPPWSRKPLLTHSDQPQNNFLS